MLSCIIVDDEPLAVDVLKQYISKTPFLELKASFTDPLQALTFLEEKDADLVFLDIEMEQLSGISFMQMIPREIRVAIVSAYSHYAIEGYEYNVVGYLLKPVDYDKFFTLAQKAFRIKNENKYTSREQSAGSFQKYIFIKEDDIIVKIDTDDVLYIEGMRNYLCIYTASRKIITYTSMKSMEALLQPDIFFRVHKSYIVSLHKIHRIERNRLFIDQKVIPIGETYSQEFFKLVESKRP